MTREEYRDYVESLRSQDKISYDVYSGLIDGIDTLEQEPCEDAISREDALMALTGEWTESKDEILSKAIRRIKALPSVNLQEPRWIPVSERLPEVEKEVQICAIRKFLNGKSQTIITHAIYEDGTVNENDSIYVWSELDTDWNEDEGCSIILKGWWEYTYYLSPFYVEGNNLIDDKVIAWRPLPQPPEEDLKDDSN